MHPRRGTAPGRIRARRMPPRPATKGAGASRVPAASPAARHGGIPASDQRQRPGGPVPGRRIRPRGGGNGAVPLGGPTPAGPGPWPAGDSLTPPPPPPPPPLPPPQAAGAAGLIRLRAFSAPGFTPRTLLRRPSPAPPDSDLLTPDRPARPSPHPPQGHATALPPRAPPPVGAADGKSAYRGIGGEGGGGRLAAHTCGRWSCRDKWWHSEVGRRQRCGPLCDHVCFAGPERYI
jgi:hypothetical protein